LLAGFAAAAFCSGPPMVTPLPPPGVPFSQPRPCCSIAVLNKPPAPNELSCAALAPAPESWSKTLTDVAASKLL